jgi:predicted nucleic acid-binding protein
MATYVVDASVITQVLITDTDTPRAIALFRQIKPSDRIHVPEFCRLECANALWKQVRFQGMPQTEAEQPADDLLALPLRVIPVTGLLKQALPIGLANQLALYDSVYIALAHHLDCPLITADQRQLRAALTAGIAAKPITDFLIPGT